MAAAPRGPETKLWLGLRRRRAGGSVVLAASQRNVAGLLLGVRTSLARSRKSAAAFAVECERHAGGPVGDWPSRGAKRDRVSCLRADRSGRRNKSVGGHRRNRARRERVRRPGKR